MSIVVAVSPGHDPSSVVALGTLMARAYQHDLVFVSVTTSAWPAANIWPSSRDKRSAADTRAAEKAQASLDRAEAATPSDVSARYVIRSASSARRGLLEAVKEFDGIRLVLGSAEDGKSGRITLGSTSTALSHGAHVPVVMVPKDYGIAPGARLTRVTVAYKGTETSAELVLRAARIASAAGTAFRIASFAPPRRGAFIDMAAGSGAESEREVAQEWLSVIRDHTDAMETEIEKLDNPPHPIEVEVGAGPNFEAAVTSIGWRSTEVLLIASSSLAALAQVNLGSRATKILRASPVPVVLVPRRAVEHYAENFRELGADRMSDVEL